MSQLATIDHISLNSQCFHCGDELGKLKCTEEASDGSIYHFCCFGCRGVYRVLNSSGQLDFYQYKNNEKIKSLKNLKVKGSFDYLDEEDNFDRKDNFKVQKIYLENIHCKACLWLIENVVNVFDDVIEARLNFENKVVTILIKESGSFSQIAQYFQSIGYFPKLVKKDEIAINHKKKEQFKNLLRLGIAGFCSGNIMLFSISNYAGAKDSFFINFNYFCGLLSLPVIFYSAFPYYRNAYYQIKNKILNIDIPISIIVLAGAIYSYIELFKQGENQYFDSLTMFIFLLIGSRTLQKYFEDKNQSKSNIYSIFENSEVLKNNSNKFRFCSIKDLKTGDLIQLKKNETIPIDCELIDEKNYINTSFLTGENNPVFVSKTQLVESGSICLTDRINLKVVSSLKDSKVSKMIDKVSESWTKKNDLVNSTDKYATYLLFFSCFLSLCTLSYFLIQGNLEMGISRAMSLLIISCPCALSLGIPLTSSLGLWKLYKNKIIVKNSMSLFKLFESEHFFFDKTGTLTSQKVNVKLQKGSIDSFFASIIYSLEIHSVHPISKSIIDYLHNSKINLEKLKLSCVEEKIGEGMSCHFLGNNYFIGKDDLSSHIVFKENDQIICEFKLDHQSKYGASQFIKWLLDNKKNVYLITGDNDINSQKMAKKLQIKKENVFSNCSPEKKVDLINSFKKSVMIGDGLNDTLAIKNSWLGIAVGNKIDFNQNASEIYIPSGKINSLDTLFKISKNIIKVNTFNISVSLFYNLIGMSLAILGYIEPLSAAIIMPISSLSVIFVSTSLLKDKNTKRKFSL